LAELIKAVRDAESMIGTGTLGPTRSEEQARHEYRLSCVAVADLPEGHRLTAEDIVYRRPGYGIPPGQAHWLDGRKLRRPVRKGHVFGIEDLA
jgi:sialic acid synthase SpsE